MKVVAYHNFPNKIRVLNSFMRGVGKYGHHTDIFQIGEDPSSVVPADYYVVLGGAHIGYKTLQKLTPRMFIHDPVVRPKVFKRNLRPSAYFSVSKDFHQSGSPYLDLPGDRWQKLQKIYDVQVKPWRKNPKHIIIAHKPEKNIITREGKDKIYRMLLEKALETGREVIFCAHPPWNNKKSHVAVIKSIKKKFPGKCKYAVGISSHLPNAYALLSVGGSCPIISVLNGVPAYSHERSVVDHISKKSLHKFLRRAPTPDRTKWLNWVAYQQWTIEEMSQGIPWSYLMENKNG